MFHNICTSRWLFGGARKTPQANEAFLMALGPLLWLISLALFACLLGNPLATPTNLELQQKGSGGRPVCAK